MKGLVVSVLLLYFTAATVEAKERLLLVAPESNIAAGKAISVDVYLYNEGFNAVKLPTLESLAAEWVLDDTTGRRLPRAGGSERITGFRTQTVLVPGRAVLHRKVKLDVRAEAGDMVTLKVTLGERRSLASNRVVLYCLSKKGKR